MYHFFGHFLIENGLTYNIWLRPRFGFGSGPSSVPAGISCRTVRKARRKNSRASKIVFGFSEKPNPPRIPLGECLEPNLHPFEPHTKYYDNSTNHSAKFPSFATKFNTKTFGQK